MTSDTIHHRGVGCKFWGSRKLHVPTNLAPPGTCNGVAHEIQSSWKVLSDCCCPNVLGAKVQCSSSRVTVTITVIVTVTVTVTVTVSLSDKMLNPPPHPKPKGDPFLSTSLVLVRRGTLW